MQAGLDSAGAATHLPRMATELHDLTVPAFVRALHALRAFLDKSRLWADEQGITHADLLEARLYDDMAPLTAQVQRVSDTIKGALVRLSGVENVPMADSETSFAELDERIGRTLAFIDSVGRHLIDGKEEATVTLTTPTNTISFTGIEYVRGFVLPNLYFHVTTAYAILRMKGVPLGKLDYLGQP